MVRAASIATGAVLVAFAIAACSVDERTASEPSSGRGSLTVRTPDGLEIDDSGHGAVLCAWSIYLILEQVGEKCFPHDDREFKRILAQQIIRIDQFIIANGPATPEQIESSKSSLRTRDPPMCTEAYTGFYLDTRRDPNKPRKSVDDLLSVPRKPVMNPCL